MAAIELARRAAASNRGNRYGETLERLTVEIEQDRDALLEAMRTLDVRPDRLKTTAAWVAEKVGRLKLNGSIVSYSPLSRLVEVEALSLGVQGKVLMWQALAEVRPLVARLGDLDLDELISRGRSQLRTLQRLRLQAAAEALAAG